MQTAPPFTPPHPLQLQVNSDGFDAATPSLSPRPSPPIAMDKAALALCLLPLLWAQEPCPRPQRRSATPPDRLDYASEVGRPAALSHLDRRMGLEDEIAEAGNVGGLKPLRYQLSYAFREGGRFSLDAEIIFQASPHFLSVSLLASATSSAGSVSGPADPGGCGTGVFAARNRLPRPKSLGWDPVKKSSK